MTNSINKHLRLKIPYTQHNFLTLKIINYKLMSLFKNKYVNKQNILLQSKKLRLKN